MSGVGVIANACAVGGFANEDAARDALKAVHVAAIVAERGGLLTLAGKHCGQVDRLVAGGRMTADAATDVKNAIRAFADQAAQGLHRSEADPDGVRAAMRPLVQAAGQKSVGGEGDAG